MAYIGASPAPKMPELDDNTVETSDIKDGAVTAAKLAAGAAVPSQTGNSGKFLKTDGSTASWQTVDALPSQTSQSGKYLKTDGTVATWDTVTTLPTQTGNSGEYLTTDGTTASWAPLTSPSKAGGTINVNSTTATESYTFPSGTNGLSVGPITLADGVSVTVASGQRWVII